GALDRLRSRVPAADPGRARARPARGVRRPDRGVGRRHLRLRRRAAPRPAPAGALHLAREDLGGARVRHPRDRRGRVLLPLRRAPDVPLDRRGGRARGGDRGRGAARRPLRVDAEARRGRQGHRPAARRPRRDARPPRRHPLRRPGGVLHHPRVDDVKRVALLGATGSIGRQAIEVIEASPELELVAASSGSTPIDGLAPLTQVGGDPIELLERAQPDVVLNAVVGFAGLEPTMWALENGVTLALANKESLVAAGELALAARRRGGGLLLPVDSEHSAAFQCFEGREPETVDALVLTASGGPFRGKNRDDLRDVSPAEALAHPTWSMGPKITIDSATLA